MAEEVKLVIGQREFKEWTRYEIESDLLKPADAFTITLANDEGKLAGLIRKFDECKIWLGDTLQLTGRVDDVTWRNGPGAGATVEVTGRDRFGFLVDAAADPETIQNLDLQAIAQRMGGSEVPTWNVHNEANRAALKRARSKLAAAERNLIKNAQVAFDVGLDAQRQAVEQAERFRAVDEREAEKLLRQALDNDPEKLAEGVRAAGQKSLARARDNVSRLRARVYPRIKVSPGQARIAVIVEAAKRAGLLVWCAADGTGVISAPHYEQRPLYTIYNLPPNLPTDALHLNNARAFSVTESGRKQFSEYRFGSTSGNTSAADKRSSIHEHTIRDDEVPFHKPKFITGASHNRAQARSRANLEQQRARFDSLVLQITVRGHRSSGNLWQPDTLVNVADEVSGFSDVYYLARRRFRVDVSAGQVTELTLHRKGLLLV